MACRYVVGKARRTETRAAASTSASHVRGVSVGRLSIQWHRGGREHEAAADYVRDRAPEGRVRGPAVRRPALPHAVHSHLGRYQHQRGAAVARKRRFYHDGKWNLPPKSEIFKLHITIYLHHLCSALEALSTFSVIHARCISWNAWQKNVQKLDLLKWYVDTKLQTLHHDTVLIRQAREKSFVSHISHSCNMVSASFFDSFRRQMKSFLFRRSFCC